MCAFFCVVLSCVGRDPEMCRSPSKESHQSVRNVSLFQKLLVNRNRPEGQVLEAYKLVIMSPC
jgi:hypothetical protein